MKKILLVEDDPFLIKIYSVKLKKEGMETLFLGDGSAVLETTEREKPDLIILDLVMPVKDGFAVIEELKTKGLMDRIPVIVLTALNSEEDKKRCLDNGAREYLVKTDTSFSEVIGKINKYLS